MEQPTEFVINHLWQSSCFVLLTALLAFVLRKNPPKVRYWVWLSASLKFLLPFALLVSLGNAVKWPAQHAVAFPAPVFSSTVVEIAEPFTPPSSAVPVHAPTHWAPIAIAIVWALGFVAIALMRCRSWLRIRATLRASTPVELPIPLPACVAPGAAEPGVVGFLRPVLVLPAGMLEHLNPRQLDAVLAHELCHVRRRDNLFAVVHMVVEAIFWFHPLVWWIGSRMVEERELACDEEVLRMGCEPTDYVEGILKVCRLYTESPLPCVSGVTGADVKKRLRTILAGSISRELGSGKKLILAAIGLVALAAPLVIGVLSAPRAQAQSPAQPQPLATRSEAARPLVAQVAVPQAPRQPPPSAALPKFASVSVKRADPTWHGWVQPAVIDAGRRFEALNTVNEMIQWAYGLSRNFQVAGGPEWVGTPYFDSSGVRVWPAREQFSIDATAEGQPSAAEMKQMVQALLADRFRLKLHRETRQIPIYAIVIGPNGPNLPPEAEPVACPQPALECGFPNIGGLEGGVHLIEARYATMANFSGLLTNNMDRPVIDKTGLTAGYSFDLTYEHPGPGWRTGPAAAIDAVQKLGLRLEPQTETMEMLVIDSIDRPSDN
jgi:bla regulator protein blaR1